MERILIVDDDARFRRALHLALNSSGYEVAAAADARGVLDMFATFAPDLIVLDWQLPDIDGVQTCVELRARTDIPVIMISGNRANLKDAALKAGANDYLAKPFSLKELLARIEFALNALKRRAANS